MERDVLIREIADDMHRADGTIGYRMIPDEAADEVLAALERLGYTIVRV